MPELVMLSCGWQCLDRTRLVGGDKNGWIAYEAEVPVVGRQEHQRIFPCVIGLNPIGDHVKSRCPTLDSPDCVVKIVAMAGPVDVSSLNH